jgi:hypothetical protein
MSFFERSLKNTSSKNGWGHGSSGLPQALNSKPSTTEKIHLLLYPPQDTAFPFRGAAGGACHKENGRFGVLRKMIQEREEEGRAGKPGCLSPTVCLCCAGSASNAI